MCESLHQEQQNNTTHLQQSLPVFSNSQPHMPALSSHIVGDATLEKRVEAGKAGPIAVSSYRNQTTPCMPNTATV